MGVGTVGTRQIAEACSKDDARSLAVVRRAMFSGTMFLASIGALAVWSLRTILATRVLGNASDSALVGWLSLGVALSVAGASQGALIQGMRRIGDIARLSVFGSIFSTVLGIGMLLRWGNAGLIAYVLVGPLVSFVLGHVYVSRLPKVQAGTIKIQELAQEWKVLLTFGLAFVGADLVGSLTQLWIRTDVVKVLGVESLGQYQAAWMISMQYVNFVLAAMGADYYPRLTGVINDHKAAGRLVNEQTEIAMLLSAPVIIGMMAMAPFVIHLLYASSFTPAIEILRWQVLGDVLKVASWPLGFVLLAAGDGKTYFWCQSVTVIIPTVLILGLVPIMGLRITGISYLAMYGFCLPLVYWLARQRIEFHWTKPVFHLSVVTLTLCAGIGIISSITRWGGLLGGFIALAFAVFSLGRLTEVSNLGGPAERIGKMARRLTGRGKAS